ncbi:uncharacterized protein B0P05DRAFT_455379, partial [Gilbertella persicaria]|uniref:uncharacterized protein n=1 Tax=Gilbertella persicaria TaxID=101096 RepID=UPI00221EC1DB
MIKGRQGIDAEMEDIENRLTATRERQRVLKSKHHKHRPAREQRQLEELEDQERILARRLRAIQQDKSSLIQKILLFLRPFELCSVDKIAFSLCGSQCGYVINHPNLFNPINYIFVKLSKVFLLDYVFMVSLILYFFLATMTGIIEIGIRFLWITLYRIKKGSTAPQGLLVSAVLLTLSLLALNYTMTTTVAPGYAHFGSQVYCNHTTLTGQRDCTEHNEFIVHCNVYGPT